MRFMVQFTFVATVVAGTALAQDARQPDSPVIRGGGIIYYMLERGKGLQEELKLNEEQVGKLIEEMKPINEKRVELMRGFNPAELTDEKWKEVAEESAKLLGEAKKVVEGVLKPEQLKRLRQIDYQLWGVRAFADKAVLAGLKITGEQQKKVKEIVDELDKAVKELQRVNFQVLKPGDDQKEASKKFLQMQISIVTHEKQAEEQVIKVLTDEQKKAWKDMQGEKFDFAKLGLPRPRRDN